MLCISCIILDYHKAEKVLKNIAGIALQDFDGEIEILVGDNSVCTKNAEILRSVEKKYANVSVHIFSRNIGYSKGNNYLVEHSKGDYIAIINPDIEWEDEHTLSTLIDYLQKNSEVGIIAPRQKERSGREALSVRSFPSFVTQVARRTFLRKVAPFSDWVIKDEMQNMDREKTQEVDWVQSSFLCLSREMWNTLGGFSEQYFLFLADTQLCKDAWDIDKKVVYFPKAIVYSDGIRCSDGGVLSLFTSSSLRTHVLDSIRYFLSNKKT